MKAFLLLLAGAFCFAEASFSQMAITTDGSLPDNSAMLDIKSSSRGLLIPRMTTLQRQSIISPSTGLLMYDTDLHKFFFHRLGAWEELQSGSGLWSRGGSSTWLTNSSDDVGIGTFSPQDKLHVNGGNVRITGSTLNTLNLVFDDQSTSSTFSLNGYQDFSILTNGLNRLTVNQNGNIGIGTETPDQLLSVNGNIQTSTNFLAPYGSSSLPTYRFGNGNEATGFSSPVSHALAFITSSSPRMYINSSGNIGIGTTVPGSLFHINGTIRISDGSQGSGKLLISDLNGNASWTSQSTISDGDWTITGVNMYSNVSGNVGIGTTNPEGTLHVNGKVIHRFNSMTDAALTADVNTPIPAYEILNSSSSTTATALTAGLTSSSAHTYSSGLYGYNNGHGNGVYGKSISGYGLSGFNNNSGNYGLIGGPSTAIYGSNTSSGNYAYIGTENNSLFGSLSSTTIGDYAVYGFRSSSANGAGYRYSETLGGVKGFSYWGNPYTFGVAGYSYLDYNRCGGTFGSNLNGDIWGCLGYKNSSNTVYGGYFTSSTTGSGKSCGAMINSGIGAWGDLFGADIHGKVYGTYSEGADYALFANGTVFRNGLDVHLQKEKEGKNHVLYTNVSTDATVQTCGFAMLSGGKCEVAFDPSFIAVVSISSPVIVTITPMGNTSGVYLAEVKSEGFRVVENNDGKSAVQISYIAIGKRAGFENPELPEAVIAADYTDKISSGLHNDADNQTNGNGLYYEHGKLYNRIHASMLPDRNKPEQDPDIRPLVFK